MITPVELAGLFIPSMIGWCLGSSLVFLIHKEFRPKTIGGYLLILPFCFWINRHYVFYGSAVLTAYLYFWAVSVEKAEFIKAGLGLAVVGLASLIAVNIVVTGWIKRISQGIPTQLSSLIYLWGAMCSVIWIGYFTSVKVLSWLS